VPIAQIQPTLLYEDRVFMRKFAWHGKAILHLEGILQSLDKGKEILFEKLALAYGTDAVKKATIEEAEFRKFLTEKQQLGVWRKTGITAPIAGVAAIGARSYRLRLTLSTVTRRSPIE
jgi:hypothetical protein